MGYTWTDGELITATKLNNTGGYDAVIRLTHSNDSGPDTALNLTPSIVSGTFSQLHTMLDDTEVPVILVEYYHPYGIYTTLTPYISYFNNESIFIDITGYLPMTADFSVIGISLIWDDNDSIGWND